MSLSKAVLVTGGSGFIGQHCILQLLEAGHSVRTTVRSLKREAAVRASLQRGGAQRLDALTFVEADLGSDVGWAPAVDGCDFVLHVASPFPMSSPKREEELIIPAREGTLRVLRASKAAGVRRVVVTSSFAAVGYGRPPPPVPFTEADWTNVDSPLVRPYVKSKAVAEKAAWEWMKAEGGEMEMAVVNPVLVAGPVLSEDQSTSTKIISLILKGRIPAVSRPHPRSPSDGPRRSGPSLSLSRPCLRCPLLPLSCPTSPSVWWT
jgi:dihydroflavonol-4-reductase